MSDAPVVAFIKDSDGRYVYANPYLLSVLGDRMGTDWLGKTDAQIWPADVAVSVLEHDAITRQSGGLQVFHQVMPMADGPHAMLMLKFPLGGPEGPRYLGGIGFDQTEHVRVEAERDRLATVVEQVAEAVMIAGLDGRITYVNPAFERVTGYASAEVLGANPRILNSGVHGPEFYRAMWAALTSGVPWVADLINRRKDGTLFTEEAVISPIRDDGGTVTSYVAVKRDVTGERAIELRSARLARERALIAETLRTLSAGDDPAATAQAICRQLLRLSGTAAAQIAIFELDGRAVPVGFAVAGEPDPPLRRLPLQRSKHLHDRTAEGPWIDPWVSRPWHPYNRLLSGLGDHLVATAPMRFDGQLVGMLIIDADVGLDEVTVTDNLAALVEFADLTGALIGREVAGRTEVGRAREEIHTIIARRAFQPVFQPIVDLETDAIVGYEALTRFADGVAPDIRFDRAAAVGVGLELEMATLAAAVAAAPALPQGVWLNLNVSPALIMKSPRLRPLLRQVGRDVVLEITEHAEIADYIAFRAAVTALGSKVRLAVDDAGAGFASLRHILELRPDFVKLDQSLVAGVDGDEARRAMIVGLHHFASATACRLIAEGIETSGERKVLHALGIPLGQGYLLGRPAPVPGS